MDKIIVEERQGTPTIKKSKERNFKKLYLESYVC